MKVVYICGCVFTPLKGTAPERCPIHPQPSFDDVWKSISGKDLSPRQIAERVWKEAREAK